MGNESDSHGDCIVREKTVQQKYAWGQMKNFCCCIYSHEGLKKKKKKNQSKESLPSHRNQSQPRAKGGKHEPIRTASMSCDGYGR